jgi:hypothetical protein
MDGQQQIADMMERFRKDPPRILNGVPVVRLLDYESREDRDLLTGTVAPISLPKSNVLQFLLKDGGKVSARPSGTEPKIKFYFSVKGSLSSARELHAATQQGDPLECAFMVFLKFSCDGKEIKPRADRSVKIQVPAAPPVADLLLWQGSANDTQLAAWDLAPDSADILTAEWPAAGNPVSGYELVVKNTGWLCAGKIQTGQRTNYCVQMPPGFDAENSQVFLLLKNSRSVFHLQPNTDNNLFCVDGAPAGLPVQLITISKLGAQFLLGNADTQMDVNSKVIVTPKYATPAEIIQLIKNL